MDYIFKKLLAGTAATVLAASLFFTTPGFKVKGDYLEVKGVLKGIFTEKVQRILKTATTINVTFHLSLVLKQNGEVKVLKKRIAHNIRFSPLKEEYLVTKGGKRWIGKDKNIAYKKFSSYKTRFRQPFKDGSFIVNFYIEAHISYKSKLELEFSGAALWDHFIPSKSIKQIKLGNHE
ncbi:MAG: hypothetical protein OEZ36_13950 [Spirochaetota bacterium]|nr:hypothetical protein [Spirochaetota bacterium]